MNIKSDNFKCYIEGIRIPLLAFRQDLSRDKFRDVSVDIPLGNIDPQMWANAYVAISYIQDNKELNLIEGLCSELSVLEDVGVLRVKIDSLWSCFNLNSTLDYTSPLKYGLQNIDKGCIMYIGTDTDAVFDGSDLESSYRLSERYMFLKDLDTIKDIKLGDFESFKLYFIINRMPFAELYAFSILEQMDYSNFILTQSFVERFNLLSKRSSTARQDKLKEVTDTTINQFIK